MRIAIGGDHRGREVRDHLRDWLSQRKYEVVDFGPVDAQPCDYPQVAFAVASAVADRSCHRGILIDGTGIGICIAANKVKGVRAALIHDEIGADMSRRHTDANVLCLAADMLGKRIIAQIVRTWLTTEFELGRHARRVGQIGSIEEGLDPRSVRDSKVAAD